MSPAPKRYSPPVVAPDRYRDTCTSRSLFGPAFGGIVADADSFYEYKRTGNASLDMSMLIGKISMRRKLGRM